jgi:competence protein ComEA
MRTSSPMRLPLWLCWSLSILSAMAAPVSSAQVVDLNTADAATLSRGLLGIGETRARAIIEYRQRHGPFRSIDELALVRGIGPKTVDRNRPRLRVTAGASTVTTTVDGQRSKSAVGAAARVLRRAPRPGGSADDAPPEILIGP